MPRTTSADLRVPSLDSLTRPGALIVVLSAGGVLVSLAQTLIGELPAMFSTSPVTASWIIQYAARRRDLQADQRPDRGRDDSQAWAGKAIALMSSSTGIGGALGFPLAAVLLATSKGADWDWAIPTTVGGALAGVAVLAGWRMYQSKVRKPLINRRTVALPPVLLTNLASILIGSTMFALNLLVPPVMQLPVATGCGLGHSMVAMGVWVMPVGIGMTAVSGLGARISRERTPKTTLIIAGLVTATGHGETALIMAVSPPEETAAANGVNSLIRSLGTASSSAVLGVLLASGLAAAIPAAHLRGR